MDIQQDNIEEYYALTEERKEELIKELQEERETREFGTHLTQRSRANDLRHSVKDIEKIVSNNVCHAMYITDAHKHLDLWTQASRRRGGHSLRCHKHPRVRDETVLVFQQ